MTNYDAALSDAIDRDLRDAERLEHIAGLIGNWLDQLAPDVADLEHPDARWHPADLVTDLKTHLADIKLMLHCVSGGPVVMDDY